MDHFYQQKLINEKNELQRQVTKANKQIAQLSEQVKQYETLLASLDEGMIPSQIRLRGDSTKVHKKSFRTQAYAPDKTLTDGEQLALVRPAQIARSKPEPPKSEGQQLNEQAEYIAVLENIIATIAQELQVKPEELIESVTLGRLDLSTLGRSIKSGLNRIMMGKKKESGIGTKLMPGTISTSPYDPYVGEKETPRGDVPQGGIPRGLFKQPSGSFQQVRSMTSDEIAYDIAKRKGKPISETAQLDEIITPEEARGSRRALALHQAKRVQNIVKAHNLASRQGFEEMRADALAAGRNFTQAQVDAKRDRGDRVARLAKRVGANVTTHVGAAGTVHEVGAGMDYTKNPNGNLKFFALPASQQQAAVDASQRERTERLTKRRGPDTSAFGF